MKQFTNGKIWELKIWLQFALLMIQEIFITKYTIILDQICIQ